MSKMNHFNGISKHDIFIFILIVVFGFVPIKSDAQINMGTRIGISTLNEVQLDLLYPIKEGKAFYSNISYAYRGFNLNGVGCGIFWPTPLYDNNNSGFSIKVGLTTSKVKVKSKSKKIKKLNHTIALMYRRINGQLHINSTGCSDFYYDYDFVANDFGIYFYRDKAFTKLATFYWGFGILARIRQDTELPLTAASETFQKNQPRLIFDMGWRFGVNLSKDEPTDVFN